MAATASAAPVAPVVDTPTDNGHVISNTSILPFLRLPRELRDQVLHNLQACTFQHVANTTRFTTMLSVSQISAATVLSASNAET